LYGLRAALPVLGVQGGAASPCPRRRRGSRYFYHRDTADIADRYKPGYYREAWRSTSIGTGCAPQQACSCAIRCWGQRRAVHPDGQSSGPAHSRRGNV